MRYYNGWKSLHALTAPRARSPICHPELTGCVAAPSPSSLSPPQTTRILPPPPRRESIPILGIEGIREGGKASSLRPVLSSLSLPPALDFPPTSTEHAAQGAACTAASRTARRARSPSLQTEGNGEGRPTTMYSMSLNIRPPPPPFNLCSIALEHWETYVHQRWSSS